VAKLATEAELRALRAQVNPHFLFNAMTTIACLVQESPARALDTIIRLTSLLRGVLRSDGEYTTLERELEIVESYLEIEQARFEQRLRVRIDVPSSIRAIRVPPLVLQPLVENAVKHGITSRTEGGEVVVYGRVQSTGSGATELALVVRDTGCGASPLEIAHGRSVGVGLQNIERRLACLYGSTASLTIRSTQGAGTVATVRLPVEVGVLVDSTKEAM
jgi:LytS/YehU family sensor histidine kinase